MKGFEV